MRTLSFPVFAWLMLFSTAVGRDVFVNNISGRDNFNGISERATGGKTGPYKTINKALRAALSSDRIIVANTDVPYRESITLFGNNNSGIPKYPFVIEGNGAILDGSVGVPEEAWEHFSGKVFRFRPRKMSHQLLFIDDRPLKRRKVNQIGWERPKLKELEWYMRDGVIYFRPENNKLPKHYRMTTAGHKAGITLFHVRHLLIKDLIIQGFHLDGINAFNSVRDCKILGVTCRGNGRSGVFVGEGSKIDLEQCVVGTNGRAQIRVEPFAQIIVTQSDVFDDTAPKWVINRGKLIVDGKPVSANEQAAKVQKPREQELKEKAPKEDPKEQEPKAEKPEEPAPEKELPKPEAPKKKEPKELGPFAPEAADEDDPFK